METDNVLLLLTDIVTEIVDEIEEVDIKMVNSEEATRIEISVSKKDIGKVIGKNGNMAKALRTICAALSGKKDHRYLVQIMD